MKMTETFLQLTAAHLLGDFVFQTDWIVKNKSRARILLLHVTIVTVLALLLLGSLHWQILLATFATHWVIDFSKLKLKKNGAASFIWDQVTHLTVIAILSIMYPAAGSNGWWPQLLGANGLLVFLSTLCLLCGVILNGRAGGILIGLLTAPMSKEITPSQIVSQGAGNQGSVAPTKEESYLAEGLKDGGKNIGLLERLLVMMFILINQPAGIGFLLAAKSILRFGEIKESSQRKVAEYIIIGTFLSFGWALVVSTTAKAGIDHWRLVSKEAVQPVSVIVKDPVRFTIEHSAGSQDQPPSVGVQPTAPAPAPAGAGGDGDGDGDGGDNSQSQQQKDSTQKKNTDSVKKQN